jgi:hypothetical protein
MCNCLHEASEVLSERNLEINPDCITYQISPDSRLSGFRLSVPIVQKGTKRKPKGGNPSLLKFNFCPLCGEKLT